jgi:NAD(P)H-nitrite reductase large subunit
VVQRGDAHGFKLTRSHGDTLCADVALSAVGLRPSAALAQAAGIHTHRGIVVSTNLQTSNRRVYALSDWQAEAGESGVKALLKNSADQLMGFALLGRAIAEKSNLVPH